MVKSIECDEDRETLYDALVSQSKGGLFCETCVVSFAARTHISLELLTFLHCCDQYVSGPEVQRSGSRMWRAVHRLKLYGAVFSTSLSVDVTHVLFDECGDEAETESLKVNH